MGFRKVIAVTCQILFPNQDGVVGLCFRIPFGVDDGVPIQIAFKDKRSLVIDISVPSAKLVTVAIEVVDIGNVVLQQVARLSGHVGLEEFRSGVGGARLDFVKRQPVAESQIFHKGDVPFYGDGVTVIINFAFLSPCHYVCVTIHNQPALKIRVVVLRHIRLVDNVLLLGGIVTRVEHVINTNHYMKIPWIAVIDVVASQPHGIEHHGVLKVVEVCGVLETAIDGVADTINGHAVAQTSGIVLMQGPSEELHTRPEIAGTGRVDDITQRVLKSVAPFHQYGEGVLNDCVRVVGEIVIMPCPDEGDHQAVSAAGDAHHIHGEVLGPEGDGVV